MGPSIRRYWLAVGVLLGAMFVLMVASSWNDSATMDELAHIPAGYSSLFLRDYRLNPEHPPLIKTLAALPLLAYPLLTGETLSFPTDTRAWRDDINGQWNQGRIFLYESGNDADAILRLMRLPMMFLAIFFGWLLSRWMKRHFGERVALLATFFYALSPTFIAHSRYVTTDLAAALAFFIGIATYLAFLREPSWRNTLFAGIAFGIAQLLKFSLVLLLPVYGVLLILWAASKIHRRTRERLALFGALILKTLAVLAVGVMLVWLTYLYPVWSYPPERQLRDADFILTSFGFRPAVELDLALIRNPVTRPLGQYLLGLLMVIQRSAGGNTQYFLGEVTAAGSFLYFPVLYLLKEPFAFHVLSAVALISALGRVLNAEGKSLRKTLQWVREHFIEAGSIVFIAIYWTSSVSSSLNIGVRHVLPTFPFVFLLVSREIISWLRPWRSGDVAGWWEWLVRIWRIYVASIPRYGFVAAMLLGQAASVLAAFPHYLSYYNALGGGVDGGYRIGVDSNYDWGQDLKRLARFVEERGIEKIAVDYFGGGDPRYYLGERFEPWWSGLGYPSTSLRVGPAEIGGGPSLRYPRGSKAAKPPEGIWFAISATFQMGAYGEPVKGLVRKPEDSYEWLKPFRPVARAGKSIFIYRLPENPPSGLSEKSVRY